MTPDIIKVFILEQFMSCPDVLQDALHEITSDSISVYKVESISALLQCTGDEIIGHVMLLPIPDNFSNLDNASKIRQELYSIPILTIGPGRRSAIAKKLLRLGIEDALPIENLNGKLLERVLRDTVARRSNEEKIHLSEAKLQTLLESVNEGLYGVDTEDFCIFANPAFVRMMGYHNSNEIVGRNIHQSIRHTTIDGEVIPFEISLTHNCIKSGKSLSSEILLQKKDGSYLWAECKATPIKYTNKITGAVVSMINVREKEEIEQGVKKYSKVLEKLLEEGISDLKESNRQYQHESEFNYTLLNTIGALVVVLDTQGRIVRFNHQCEEVTGYTFHEVAGKKVWDIFLDPNELQGVKNVFHNLLAGNFPNSHKNFWYTKSGNQRCITWSNSALLDDSGNVEYIIASGIDITEKLDTEKELDQSKNLYHILASNIPGIVYRTALSGDHKTTYLNDMVVSMTGYVPDEIAFGVVCGCDSIIHEDDRKLVIDQVKKAISENKPFEVEYRIRRKDGQIRYFSDRGRPILSDNSLAYLEGVIFDITERKEIVQKEQQRLQEIAHANRLGAMGEMATEIAHELNQPLGSITIYCDASLGLLNNSNLDKEALKNALTGIQNQAIRASEIIKGLRNFVGKHASSPSTTNISELVKSVVKLCEIEARANNISIELQLENNIPEVLSEKILIEQVVLNLIRNAIDALAGIQDIDRKIHIQALHKNNEIIVTIQDTGNGLPFPDPQDAFNTFVSTKINGMGMGLPISKRIIEAHGGKLIVKSSTSEGTTFQFTLPVKDHRQSI